MARVMVRLGLLAEITVVGRKSGVERIALINKRAAPGGGYYVGAGDGTHQWARNLQAVGRCRLRVKGVEAEYTATEPRGAERDTMAKSLAPPFSEASKAVGGPIFRLDPAD